VTANGEPADTSPSQDEITWIVSKSKQNDVQEAHALDGDFSEA